MHIDIDKEALEKSKESWLYRILVESLKQKYDSEKSRVLNSDMHGGVDALVDIAFARGQMRAVKVLAAMFDIELPV